ncbi:MAG: hypothetical protein HUJ68_06905 [Clostridia bacterium]|nr:hypothetical protein [Clostridia bacterium]
MILYCKSIVPVIAIICPVIKRRFKIRLWCLIEALNLVENVNDVYTINENELIRKNIELKDFTLIIVIILI